MNVEELLQSRDVYYVPRAGDFLITCLNPEHPDNHPSMRIDQITGIFNCLACGFKGNLFKHFGERVNIVQARRDMLKKKIQAKLAESIGLAFPTNCTPYVGDWRAIKPETYEKFEAFQSLTYAGRLMFPIKDVSGRIAAFIGRSMGAEVPRYLVTPSGARLPLYPVVEPIQGSVILVEGIFDCINLHDKGLTNAIACFGTKNVNEDKLAMLKIQGVEEVIVWFDGDKAGQDAAEIVKNLCNSVELVTRNVCLDGKDPGDMSEAQVHGLGRKLYD